MPTKNNQGGYHDYEEDEGIAFEFVVPIGDQPLEYYKKHAAAAIATQIVDKIPPEFMEHGGYETMTYRFVVVPMDEDDALLDH